MAASDWAASPSHRTAQVTPDGQYLAFMSLARATGYDNEPQVRKTAPTRRPHQCEEIYEYDADSGQAGLRVV